MRPYAHTYPENVAGLILTDGLHEDGMARLPVSFQLMEAVFTAGFLMSVAGSILGLIRILQQLGIISGDEPQT